MEFKAKAECVKDWQKKQETMKAFAHSMLMSPLYLRCEGGGRNWWPIAWAL